MNFNTMLNWQLLKGSHHFPGPRGGTCFLEAAVVAAGYEYRRVSSAHDTPRSFSGVLGAVGLVLNDFLPDDARQKLLPLVAKMEGTGRDPVDEKLRAEYIAREMSRFARCSPAYTAEEFDATDYVRMTAMAIDGIKYRYAYGDGGAYGYMCPAMSTRLHHSRVNDLTALVEIFSKAFEIGAKGNLDETLAGRRLEDAKKMKPRLEDHISSLEYEPAVSYTETKFTIKIPFISALEKEKTFV